MQIACHHCDQICHIPELGHNQQALCPACNGAVAQSIDGHHEYLMPMSIAALILLGLSIPFKFVSFSKQGLYQSIRLPDAADMMLQYGHPFLAGLINLTIILLPASILILILLVQSRLVSVLPKSAQIISGKALFLARQWSMPEIFLVGVLVSLIKITSLADVSIGPSFWAFSGFVICFIFSLLKLDRKAIWDHITHHAEFLMHFATTRAVDDNLAACPQCEILTQQARCPRCATAVVVRDPHNLQKTIALTITAAILYIPANVYPIMTTVFFSDREPSTIIGGVAILWHSGSYPIALVILIASVIIPLAKLTTLVILAWVVKRQCRFNRLSFTKIYSIVEFLGKWSMVDVFVVAILVALVHLTGIMEVIPGPGAIFFSAMVIISMLAAHIFDPKQLWDIEQETPNT